MREKKRKEEKEKRTEKKKGKRKERKEKKTFLRSVLINARVYAGFDYYLTVLKYYLASTLLP